MTCFFPQSKLHIGGCCCYLSRNRPNCQSSLSRLWLSRVVSGGLLQLKAAFSGLKFDAFVSARISKTHFSTFSRKYMFEIFFKVPNNVGHCKSSFQSLSESFLQNSILGGLTIRLNRFQRFQTFLPLLDFNIAFFMWFNFDWNSYLTWLDLTSEIIGIS